MVASAMPIPARHAPANCEATSQGLGLRVYCLGFRVQDVEFRVLNTPPNVNYSTILEYVITYWEYLTLRGGWGGLMLRGEDYSVPAQGFARACLCGFPNDT